MSSNSDIRCPLCLGSFRRVEHLRRHLNSHTNIRPFSCIFCNKSFQRSDVLKRHWETCKTRIESGLSIPPASSITRKSKRQVCDNCARLKRACSLGSPCDACFVKSQHCSYPEVTATKECTTSHHDINQELISSEEFSLIEHGSGIVSNSITTVGGVSKDTATTLSYIFPEIFYNRPLGLGIHSTETPPLFSQYSTDFQAENVASTICSLEKLDFLNQITALYGMRGIVNCFECGSLLERLEVSRATWYDNFFDPDNLSFTATSVLETYENNEVIQTISPLDIIRGGLNLDVPPTDITTTEEYSGFPRADLYFDPLTTTAAQIVRRLKSTMSYHPKGTSWSPWTEEMCTKFFNPSNIRKFIRLFWCIWYPNCPIIHKPTFCLLMTPLPLLISMCLIGACVSVDEEDRQGVHMWFDGAEQLVFTEECFQDALTGSSERHNYSRHELLQALQASYLVCVYQIWEGSNKSRERIRRLRYSMIVTVARNLDLSTGTHRKLNLANFDWHEFVRDEELIRTLIYVFLIDTAFTIFNNFPPRMAVTELKMNLACPESCFQAQSADECLLQLRESSFTSQFNTVASVMETICEGEIRHDDWGALTQIGVLNSFVIISALHVLIFNSKTSLAFKVSIMPIQQGLKGWKQLWDERRTLMTSTPLSPFYVIDMWKRDGFMKHAGEYWTLATMQLERMKSLSSSHPTAINSKAGVAEKYDDTNLEQVIDLIKGFRGLAL